MLHFYPYDEEYFKDDNATRHRVRSVRNCFTEHQSDFQHLPWSLHSPDLKSVENVWDVVERHIQQNTLLSSDFQVLKCRIANASYSLDVNAL
ncbi:hypothetical protein TNCV_4221901 [Trichonephila clavipes]|nr:hypothetical protein TNCV_4221901 [Trichonephila clavipes]